MCLSHTRNTTGDVDLISPSSINDKAPINDKAHWQNALYTLQWRIQGGGGGGGGGGGLR